MEIAHVTADVHGRNLPSTLAALIEAANDPRDYEAGVVNALTERNKVSMRRNLLSMAGKIEDGLLLFLG